MGLPIKEAVERLNNSAEYKKLFKKIFGQLPNAKNLGAAMAAFEKTLETVDSKFDDWSNNLKELTAQEERGRELFVGDKAKCFNIFLRLWSFQERIVCFTIKKQWFITVIPL